MFDLSYYWIAQWFPVHYLNVSECQVHEFDSLTNRRPHRCYISGSVLLVVLICFSTCVVLWRFFVAISVWFVEGRNSEECKRVDLNDVWKTEERIRISSRTAERSQSETSFQQANDSGDFCLTVIFHTDIMIWLKTNLAMSCLLHLSLHLTMPYDMRFGVTRSEIWFLTLDPL